MAALATTIVIGNSAVSRAPESLIGQVLDSKFLVRDVVGRGGCSTVYLGWHLGLECPVAIKVLEPTVASNSELRSYFDCEAMITAQLVGPHTVHVYDRGVINQGQPYTVLEYLQGQPLGSFLKKSGRLPVGLAVELALQVCTVLVEAHAHAIAHCDIKPENLFLTELSDGSMLLKVIDFGTARGKHAPDYIWRSCVGTPGYMAPEQIRDPARVDHRADIWALGVVLFQMVSGKLPFGDSSASSQMVATLKDAPTSLCDLVPELPPGLHAIVERCLAKDPKQRFQTATELATALRGISPFATGSRLLERALTGASPASRPAVPRSGVFSIRRNRSTADAPARQRTLTTERRFMRPFLVAACLGTALGTQFPASSCTTVFPKGFSLFDSALATNR